MNTKILFQSPYKFTDYQLHAGVNASIQKEGFLGRFIFRLASTAVSNAVAGMALTVHKLCLIGAVAAAAIGLVAQNTALTDHALDHAQTLGFLILADMTEVLKTTIQLAFKVLAFVGAFLEPFVRDKAGENFFEAPFAITSNQLIEKFIERANRKVIA